MYLYSDLIFTMILIIINSHLWYFSAFFVVIPHLCGNCIAAYNINKWQHRSIYISKYINHYDWLIVTLSCLAGFYTAIELCRSKLFYLSMFSMQLKGSDYLQVQRFRLFTTVLFELRISFCLFNGL